MKREALLGVLRIALGWIFLWAFADKLWGLGFSTASDKSWLLGGSPTYGFLSSSSGFFSSMFHVIAGNIFVDWVFMIGLLLLGIALILGIARKLTLYGGGLMLFLMWLAVLPPKQNPIIDEHIIYIIVLWILERFNAGDYFGFGKKWRKFSLVKRKKWLE